MDTKLHYIPYDNKQTVLFPSRIDEDIAPDDPVRIIDAVIESLGLENFKMLYRERGRSPYNPMMLLKVVVYAYMNNIFSCRKIENALRRDIHFIWLAGYNKPDYITINRFRNRVKQEINNVFTRLVLIPAEKGFISLDVEYIDGTKIESKANKYTFVWRKTVEKNRAKLLDKIKVLLEQVDEATAQDKAGKTSRRSVPPPFCRRSAMSCTRAWKMHRSPFQRKTRPGVVSRSAGSRNLKKGVTSSGNMSSDSGRWGTAIPHPRPILPPRSCG